MRPRTVMSSTRLAGSSGPAVALAWSGGKDSAHVLGRLRAVGHRVTHLFTVVDGRDDRVRFHGVRAELIGLQAEAAGCELVCEATTRAAGFEGAFDRALERLHSAAVSAVAFGNVHLADVRQWYEVRTTARGFEHLEPLWAEDPETLARAAVEVGWRALVVSVDLERGDPDWVGRELDAALLAELTARPEIDPCGERGEYHTFVWDGPEFSRPVSFRRGEAYTSEGHRILDLEPGREAAEASET